jgi:hypothetical protein
MELKYKAADLRKLEKEIVKRVKELVFSTRRNTAKKNGKYVIEKQTGDLERSITGNKNFIKPDKKGNLSIDLKVMEYYVFLDEGTSKMKGWFLTEAIFEDDEVRKAIKELQQKTTKRAILNVLSDIKTKD